jgi:predicted Zn-dependent protease
VLGLIAREEDRDDEARWFFERVRQFDPRDTGAAVNLAQMHIQNQRYAEAIALLEPAFNDEPYSVTAAYNLGMALLRSGQRERGQQLIERSQTLRTTGYGTTFSSAYLERGKYAEALASTGAEQELVNRATPGATFTMTTLTPGATPQAPESVRPPVSRVRPDVRRRATAGCVPWRSDDADRHRW